MKKMKINSIKIIALIAVLFLSVASFAGNKATKMTVDQRATLRMQKINEVCNLSAQQQAEVKQLFVAKISKETSKENKSLKSTSAKTDRKALLAAKRAENQEFGKSLKSVLSTEQQTKWQTFNKSQKAKGPAVVKK